MEWQIHTVLILESHQIFNSIKEGAKKQPNGLYKQRENVKQTHPNHWVSSRLHIPAQGPRSGVKTSRVDMFQESSINGTLLQS